MGYQGCEVEQQLRVTKSWVSFPVPKGSTQLRKFLMVTQEVPEPWTQFPVV